MDHPLFVTIGDRTLNVGQILWFQDRTVTINGGEVDGLYVEFIRHGSAFIPGVSRVELDTLLANS